MEEPATSVTSSLWASLNGWLTSTVLFVLLNLMIATIVFTSNLPNNNQQYEEEQNEHEERKRNSINQPQIARSPSILHRLKSFNFYPQKSQHESSPEETHYLPQPLEVAATQYVFNQPLEYQHFDFDSSNSVHDLNRINEIPPPAHTDAGSDLEPEPVRGDTGFDFDFDLTRNEIRGDTGFGFEPTSEEQLEHADELQSLDEVYSRLKTGRHDRTKSDGNIRPKPASKPAAKMKKSASLKVGFAHLEEEEIVEARRPATVKEKRTAAVKMEHDDDVEVDSRADDFINKFKNDLKLQRIESIMRTKGTANRGAGN
ncbi:hypothetical protein SSX86_006038 [Deinandra increscens subsp. villosa]|uniref:DUF4408 domain-containing protein n=1 Tax=Deinandra increscens subsp. villosa TaxID=3103831 RepID=A0AAP0HAE2_9ASTR